MIYSDSRPTATARFGGNFPKLLPVAKLLRCVTLPQRSRASTCLLAPKSAQSVECQHRKSGRAGQEKNPPMPVWERQSGTTTECGSESEISPCPAVSAKPVAGQSVRSEHHAVGVQPGGAALRNLWSLPEACLPSSIATSSRKDCTPKQHRRETLYDTSIHLYLHI